MNRAIKAAGWFTIAMLIAYVSLMAWVWFIAWSVNTASYFGWL